jgi:hypothetical protein
VAVRSTARPLEWEPWVVSDAFHPRAAPEYFGDDVYIAYARTMAQAQQFELALGLFAFAVRAMSDQAFVGRGEAWVQEMQSGRRDELAAYAMRLARMTAGMRARELRLPTVVTDDVTTTIEERNFLTHHWFREYAARRDGQVTPERAVVALKELEERLRRRSMAFWLLVEQLIEGRGTLREADVTRTWEQVVLSE